MLSARECVMMNASTSPGVVWSSLQNALYVNRLWCYYVKYLPRTHRMQRMTKDHNTYTVFLKYVLYGWSLFFACDFLFFFIIHTHTKIRLLSKTMRTKLSGEFIDLNLCKHKLYKVTKVENVVKMYWYFFYIFKRVTFEWKNAQIDHASRVLRGKINNSKNSASLRVST